MNSVVNYNDDGDGHANNHDRIVEQPQDHHNSDSSDETFFDYSDVEEGDNDGDTNDEVPDTHTRRGSNDPNDTNLLGNTLTSRPHRSSQDFETTALERHIQRMDWPAVLRRIKIYPQECCTVDITNGQTPLHVACHAGAPAVIIQSLCQAYPEASIRTDRCNMNPLHITCSSDTASLNTVHALLNHGSSEQISMRDVDGDTPLHAACRCGANKDVIHFLLQAYPNAVHVHDYEGFTPLVRLWVRYYVILGEAEIYNAIECPSRLENDVRFLTAWDQTLLLLRYAYQGNGNMASASSSLSLSVSSTTQPTSIYATSVSFRQQIQSSAQRVLSPPRNSITMNSMFELPLDPEELFVLHAVSAVDCPRFVVQLAIRKYPTQLFQRDEHGRSPLMIACAAPIYPYHNLSDDMSWTHDNVDDDNNNNNNDNDDGSTDHSEEQATTQRSIETTHETNLTAVETSEESESLPHVQESKLSVIELILQSSKILAEMIQSSPEQKEILKYGGADWVDPSGRLPLHIAIDSGKTWNDGIDALIKIYPESISITDRSTKLFPYQLAATKAIQNDSAVNDCYKLLRLNPTVLSMNNSGPSATTTTTATLTGSAGRSDDTPISSSTTFVETITPTVTDTGTFLSSSTNDFSTIDRDDFFPRKRRKF